MAPDRLRALWVSVLARNPAGFAILLTSWLLHGLSALAAWMDRLIPYFDLRPC